MERLTKKNRDYYHLYDEEVNELLIGAYYEKLQQLEDLEEQLGCPLDLYVKTTQNGIWIEELYDGYEDTGLRKIIYVYPEDLRVSNGEILVLWEDSEEVYMELKLSDYRKTWWLREDKSE